MTTPAIRLEKVSFAYNGELVLREAELSVMPLDFVVVVGPNGGGKTTMLKLVMGRLRPNSGSVRIFGQSPDRVRSRLGYLPQHPLLDDAFPITAREVVLTGRLGRRWTARYSAADQAAAEQALAAVDLADLDRRSFATLSGGQRQRVLIARALAGEPDLLVLDEPTVALDPQAESEFYRLLHRLNEKLTILMVSHDLNFVSSFVKTVVCVNRRVVVHPTGEIPADMAGDVLTPGMRMILHDRLRHNGEGC